MWKGTISFGLVNIPIKLYNAIDTSQKISFNQLDSKGHRVQYKKWCSVEEREVPYTEIKKGYELAKDKYVVIEKEDLEEIAIDSTRTIAIKEFISEQELDPLFVERSYYIAPDSTNKRKTKIKKQDKDTSSSSSTKATQDKAYSLLVKILHDTNKIAIGKVVLSDGENEHLVAIRAYQRGFILHTLHYLDEIRPVEDIKEISETKVPEIDKNEMSLGKLLVESLTSKGFDISRYNDEYTEKLQDLIRAKSKGELKVIRQAVKKPKQTQDLIAALKASLAKPPSSSAKNARKGE